MISKRAIYTTNTPKLGPFGYILLFISLFLIILIPNQACSEEAFPFVPYSNEYTGAFIGLGLSGGPSYTSIQNLSSGWGINSGAHLRFNHVANMVDGQLSYSFGKYSLEHNKNNLDYTHHNLVLSAGFHPLFFLILGNNRYNFTLASIYLQVGASAEYHKIDLSNYPAEWAFGFHIGFGFDIPLDDPNDGGGFWFGVNYRFNSSKLDQHPSGTRRISEHLFLLRITYRHNGLIF